MLFKYFIHPQEMISMFLTKASDFRLKTIVEIITHPFRKQWMCDSLALISWSASQFHQWPIWLCSPVTLTPRLYKFNNLLKLRLNYFLSIIYTIFNICIPIHTLISSTHHAALIQKFCHPATPSPGWIKCSFDLTLLTAENWSHLKPPKVMTLTRSNGWV